MKKHHIKYLFLVGAIVLFTSCGMWRNFKAYFNTYFNAKTIYEEVETQILEARDGRYTYTDENLKKYNQDLVKVIKKGSAVMKNHAESAYYDNALFLIGKAFYYQGNYAGATRSFEDFLKLPDTDNKLEALFWLGKSLLHQRKFEEGLATLDDLREKAKAEERNDLITESLIFQTAFYTYREDFLNAVDYCQLVIKSSDEESLLSETYYKLGVLYKELKQPEKAAESFAKVADYEAEYDIEFNSKYQTAVLYRELDKDDESEDILLNMKEDTKNEDNYDLIDLELGLLKYKHNKVEEAYEVFDDVDTTYKNSAAAGRAKMMKAKIWEQNYANFDSSSFFYDKALSTQMDKEYKDEARRKKDLYTRYFKLRKDIDKYSKEYLYSIDSTYFIEDSLAYEAYANRDTTEFQLEEVPEDFVPPTKPVKSQLETDSLNSLVALNKYDLGNMFLAEYIMPDSAIRYYNDIQEYNKVPYLTPKVLFSTGTYYATIGEKEKADSVYQYIYQNYRTSSVAKDAASQLGIEFLEDTSNPADSLYLQAEDLIETKKYNNAITLLSKINEDYPESDLAPRSLYTIGFLLENELSDPDSAAVIYDTLTAHYKTSEYARDVSKKLREYNREQKRIQDSIKAAEKAIADSIAALNAPVPEDSLATPGGDSTNVAPADSVNTNVKQNTKGNNEDEDAEGNTADTQQEELPEKQNIKGVQNKNTPKAKPGASVENKTDTTKADTTKGTPNGKK